MVITSGTQKKNEGEDGAGRISFESEWKTKDSEKELKGL